jgi:hypothetical protein
MGPINNTSLIFVDDPVDSYNPDDDFFEGMAKIDFFNYCVIIVIFLAIFSRLHIGLNIVFGLVLAVLLVMYFKSKKTEENNKIEQDQNTKVNMIKPASKIISKYPEFNDFLYSIQEFYGFSPPNYENMVDSIEDFIILYENGLFVQENAGIYYELAEKKKSDALNALHSIIFSITATEKKYYVDKISDACDQLSFMLSSYLYELYQINDRYIMKNGYNINTKVNLKESDPKPSNFFLDLDENLSGKYTYEIY